MKTFLRPQTLGLIVLACGVALTLFAWHVAGQEAEREANAEFKSHANLATSTLERRIQRYLDLLYGLEALAYHEQSLSSSEFSNYVTALDLPRRFPGVRAVAFLRRVTGAAGEQWVVEYIEPLQGNEPVIGLDVRTRAVAREAAERARDTGEPSATGRYRLVQEKAGSHGLVIYLPLYTQRVKSIDKRRDSLAGFVNVVLRVDDTLADLLSEPLLSALRMRIHDMGPVGIPAPPPGPETLFYQTHSEEQPLQWWQWRGNHERRLAVAGRQWALEFTDAPTISPWLSRFPLLVLLAGLSMSLLLYGIFRAIARARSDAMALAAKATREVRTQLSFTQQLLEAMPNPVYFKDASGRFLGCNRAFEDYLGLPREEIIGKTVSDLAPGELAQRSMIFDKAVLDQPGAQAYESKVVHARDGGRHDVLINKATFFAPSGEIAGLVGVLVDITERKKLEADTRQSNERLRAVIHATPLAIVARDLQAKVRMWNPAAERMFGWKEEEVIGTRTSIVPAHLRGEVDGMRARAEAGETITMEETQRLHRDGHVIDVALSIAPIHGADGKVNGTMVTIADIRPRKQAEAALRESESHLRLAMDAAQMGMWYWECDTDRFTYSEGLSLLFGYPAIGPPTDYRLLQERLHPDDRELFEATMRHAVKKGTDFQVDYRVVWPDGSVHWIANRAQVHRGPDGRALRVVGVAMNITERKIAEQRIAHMAHHDALTGLPNRVLLRDRIQQAIAQAHRNGTQLAVLFVDLDHFKTINDSLGHQLGDRLLQSVASRILVCVREGDTVSRVGGDEFVIVIPGLASAADASGVAAKILDVLASAFHLHGNDLHVAASIGISLYPADGADAETLMRHADTAMYHAKDSGRANFQFFTQYMNVAAQQRLSLENALRGALENQEFELHYQPLYDLNDRSITGFEALLRWHPEGGAETIAPSEFIAAAEESGLIIPIGEWALREALRQAKAWQSPGRPLTMAVNVSANQLSRSNFVERLRSLLQEMAIDPSLIELEVTESVIIEGAGEATSALDELAALGVGIAIDDFGTGYSGLAYLKRLPIDTVKIDQSFVRDLTTDPDDAAIVTAILAMAKSLGVDVVAEGVETEEQLEELKRLGCHRAQGFLLAAPMTAAAVALLLAGPAASAAAE
jgi:diguanylate cyclase (GGDEF)-like protein/PAS domain S-box-containing protein